MDITKMRAALTAGALSMALTLSIFSSGQANAQTMCPPLGWSGSLAAFLEPGAKIATQEPDSDCAFHEWSWETFVWATALDKNGVPRFMSLPTPDDMSFKFSAVKKSGKLTLKLATRTHGKGGIGEKEGAGAIVEADGNMLVGLNGYPVYASVHMNQPYFEAAVSNLISTGNYKRYVGNYFPVGSAVFKATWLRVDSGNPPPAGAFVTQAEVPVLTKNAFNVVVPAVDSLAPGGGKIKTVTATVALVGLHVVGQTAAHPEFLWGTFEHHLNSPRVADNTFVTTGSNGNSYTFYQQGTSYANVNVANQGPPGVLGFDEKTQRFSPVTQVVQLNQTGGENNPGGVANIGAVNMSGQAFLASNRKVAIAQRIFANYDLIGTVWMSPNTYVDTCANPSENPCKPANIVAPTLNQANAVGSISLANSTAETFQQIASIYAQPQPSPLPPAPAPAPPVTIAPANFQNCFACHNAQSFSGSTPALPARRVGISHVVANNSVFAVANQLPICADTKAGPIWNNDDAKEKCPQVCQSVQSAWNGQWRTTNPGSESVCGCCGNPTN